MIKISFEDTYEPETIAEDLSYMTFYSEIKYKPSILLKVKITSLSDPLLPDVFNLAFGQPLGDNEIDDVAKINHLNRDKMFSTILLFALLYLQTNPKITIGLDGSNDVRAYLYHRMFQTNKEYLGEYFIAIGVDWYVKLLRNGGIEMDSDDLPYFKPRPEPFDHERPSTNLYRYYMFQLKP